MSLNPWIFGLILFVVVWGLLLWGGLRRGKDSRATRESTGSPRGVMAATPQGKTPVPPTEPPLRKVLPRILR